MDVSEISERIANIDKRMHGLQRRAPIWLSFTVTPLAIELRHDGEHLSVPMDWDIAPELQIARVHDELFFNWFPKAIERKSKKPTAEEVEREQESHPELSLEEVYDRLLGNVEEIQWTVDKADMKKNNLLMVTYLPDGKREICVRHMSVPVTSFFTWWAKANPYELWHSIISQTEQIVREFVTE